MPKGAAEWGAAAGEVGCCSKAEAAVAMAASGGAGGLLEGIGRLPRQHGLPAT